MTKMLVPIFSGGEPDDSDRLTQRAAPRRVMIYDGPQVTKMMARPLP